MDTIDDFRGYTTQIYNNSGIVIHELGIPFLTKQYFMEWAQSFWTLINLCQIPWNPTKSHETWLYPIWIGYNWGILGTLKFH